MHFPARRAPTNNHVCRVCVCAYCYCSAEFVNSSLCRLFAARNIKWQRAECGNWSGRCGRLCNETQTWSEAATGANGVWARWRALRMQTRWQVHLICNSVLIYMHTFSNGSRKLTRISNHNIYVVLYDGQRNVQAEQGGGGGDKTVWCIIRIERRHMRQPAYNIH